MTSSTDTEIWKTTSGAMHFLGYVSQEVAGLLAIWHGETNEFNVFVTPWAENTRLVALAVDYATNINYRQFQYGSLFEVTTNPSGAGRATLDLRI